MPAANVVSMARRKRDHSTISQSELRTFYNLQEHYLDVKSRYLAQPDNYNLERQFEDVRAEYHADRAKLRSRIANGAAQQPGKYAMRPKTYFRRSVSYKSVVIALKGEAYQQRLLAKAEPKAYTRLEFEDIGNN